MAGISLEDILFVRGNHLKQPIAFRSLEVVNGRKFFKLAKQDHVISRLLLGTSSSKTRRPAKTDVLEQLQMLRNTKIENIVTPPALDDLALDDIVEEAPQRKKQKTKVSMPVDAPPIIEIVAPTIGSATEMKMNTLFRKKYEPIWLELTEAIIEYLVAAVDHQIVNESIDKSRVQHQVDQVGDGVTYETRRKAWRARRPNGQQKYFLVARYEDAYTTASTWSQGTSDSNDEMIPPLADEHQGDNVGGPAPIHDVGDEPSPADVPELEPDDIVDELGLDD